jgi:hypothetical protein
MHPPFELCGERMCAEALPFTAAYFDIKGYSEGGIPRHTRLQDGLQWILETACADAGVDREKWDRQPGGDSELALIPAGVPKRKVLTDLVAQLIRALDNFNLDKADGFRIRLRMALDHGDVAVNGANFAGQPPITAGRLCDADELRAALVVAPKTDLAMIVSDRFYIDCVKDGGDGIRPELYRRVLIKNKEFEEPAWIYVPGHSSGGAIPPEAASAPPAESPTSVPNQDTSAGNGPAADVAFTFNGPIKTKGATSFGGNAIQKVYGRHGGESNDK